LRKTKVSGLALVLWHPKQGKQNKGYSENVYKLLKENTGLNSVYELATV